MYQGVEERSDQVSLAHVEQRIAETRSTLVMLERLHAALTAGGGERLAIIGPVVLKFLQYAGPSQLDQVAVGTGLPRCEVEAFLVSLRTAAFFAGDVESSAIGCRDDGTFYYRQRAAVEKSPLDGCRRPNIGIRITSFLKRTNWATPREIAAETLLPLDDVEAYLLDAYQYREVKPGVWALKPDQRSAELTSYRLPDVAGGKKKVGRPRRVNADGKLNAHRITSRRGK